MAQKQKHVLIDGDPLVYRSCCTREVATLEEAINFTDHIIDRVLWDLHEFPDEDGYTIFLSKGKTFRNLLYPEYKSNRKGLTKPLHWEEVRQHTIDHWGAVGCEGYEADDGISIEANKRGFKNVIVVSADKDFRQLPVEIYNTYSWKREFIPKEEARYNYWYQVLIGDPIDNIKGCRGVGKAKAPAILRGCKKEEDYERAVLAAYVAADSEKGPENFALNRRLVGLLKNKAEYYKIMESFQ